MEAWERTLRNEPHFHEAMDAFIELQIQGAVHTNLNENIRIADLLDGIQMWEDMDDRTHQRVGYLIAHHCAEFAALCREPVCIIFDHADKNGDGIYRRLKYRKQL